MTVYGFVPGNVGARQSSRCSNPAGRFRRAPLSPFFRVFLGCDPSRTKRYLAGIDPGLPGEAVGSTLGAESPPILVLRWVLDRDREALPGNVAAGLAPGLAGALSAGVGSRRELPVMHRGGQAAPSHCFPVFFHRINLKGGGL